MVVDKDFETNLWTVEKSVFTNDKIEKITLKIPSLFLIFDCFDKESIRNCDL